MARKRVLTYERPPLYREQKAAIFHGQRYGVVEASTKAGKTYACLVWLFELFIVGEMGWQFWWVAPSYPQARIAYRRLRRAIARLKLPDGIFRFNETELSCVGPKGQVLTFKTGEKPDLLYGDDVHACVMDEYTRLREDAWFAIQSTITATGGSVRLIGNVKGKKNWGFVLARKAEAGERGWHYAKLTADDAVRGGVLKQERIDDAKRNLPPEVFRELYYAEATEDGSNPFGIAQINACIDDLSTDDPAAWGWDLAKSMDWTVGTALDVMRRVCRFERWQRPWEECEEDILAATGGKVPAMVDSTGVGDPIVERLQRKSPNFVGFNFGAKDRNLSGFDKQKLMERLRAAIRNREIRFPEGPIATELRQFEFHHTRNGTRYLAPDGMHDDCVMSLALVVHLFSAVEHRTDPLLATEVITEERMAELVKEERAREAKILAEEMARAGMAQTVEDEDRGWRSI